MIENINLILRILLVFSIALIFGLPLLSKNKEEIATFAGGCFWCMEADFDKLNGIVDVYSGYTGGAKANPTYEEVCSGTTGHIEAVQIVFDPDKITYAELVDFFWQHVDPTDKGGQFADRGTQYKTAIFYHSNEQRKIAEKSKAALDTSGKFRKPIATEILKAETFYKAEDYHQGYYKKNPVHYKLYRNGSGREKFLQEAWKNENVCDYKKAADKLTPLQYHVTQENGTEQAFKNEYWDNKREGIYVDVVSGEVLFSSLDKFDSGSGWPSFTKPLEPGNIYKKSDNSLFASRTEVRSKRANSHLGHVFDDGPAPTGMRYCMNSAALRFIPKEDLEKEGYGKYKKLFEK